MKGKLKLIVPLAVLALAGLGYNFAFAGEPPPEPKVAGKVYVLGKEFLVNLDDGRFAKLQVAVVHDPGEKKKDKYASTPPDGYGDLPQEGLVRSIVTDTIAGVPADDLIRPKGRAALQKEILRRVKRATDVHATEVVFTDVTVQ